MARNCSNCIPLKRIQTPPRWGRRWLRHGSQRHGCGVRRSGADGFRKRPRTRPRERVGVATVARANQAIGADLSHRRCSSLSQSRSRSTSARTSAASNVNPYIALTSSQRAPYAHPWLGGHQRAGSRSPLLRFTPDAVSARLRASMANACRVAESHAAAPARCPRATCPAPRRSGHLPPARPPQSGPIPR